MRQPPSWPFIAGVLVLLTGGLLAHFIREKTKPSKPHRSTPDLPKHRGAPTNVPPGRKKKDDGPPTIPERVDHWRRFVARPDPAYWSRNMSEVLNEWDLFRPHMIRLAKSDPNDKIRANAIHLMIIKKEGELVPLFVQRLRLDPSPHVQANCLRALGVFRARKYTGMVREFLNHETTKVATQARKALELLE